MKTNLLAERQSLALTKFQYVPVLNVAGVIVPTFWDISNSDSAVAVNGLLGGYPAMGISPLLLALSVAKKTTCSCLFAYKWFTDTYNKPTDVIVLILNDYPQCKKTTYSLVTNSLHVLLQDADTTVDLLSNGQLSVTGI